MSFYFEVDDLEAPAVASPPTHARFGGRTSYEMSGAEMAMMVEVMREAGALRERGMGPNWDIQSEGVSHDKFRSGVGPHVTPEECRWIAVKMREAIDSGDADMTVSFFDDAPEDTERWLESWTEFNARAAQSGGYWSR